MTEQGYNGWANYPTWNVALWIDNDQGWHAMVREMAQDAIDDADDAPQVIEGIWTPYDAARFTFEDALRELIEDAKPDGAFSGMYSDLLGWALESVNWLELATHYVDGRLAQEVSA